MSAAPSVERPVNRPRVFGVGLNKTGTSSFHEAVTTLGFESLHWGGPPVRRKVEEALATGQPLLANLEPRYDAFSDILPLTKNFRRLDEQYPGSRFVLTVRPVDEWIDSRRRHVARNVLRREAGEYGGDFLVVDEAAWRAEWDEHVGAVRGYFAGRVDFLEMDLIANPDWRPLCDLLGMPEPALPFPHVNRSQAEPNPR